MRQNDIMLDGHVLETAWWGPTPEQAPTLVLLHEGLGCVALWRDFPERLQAATGCGVFAWSRLGYGGSDPVTLPRPMTYMHDEARDVLPKLLDHIGVRQVITIGHSDGGSIAAIHAGMAPDPRVLGIVMIAAHFFVEALNIASIAQIKVAYQTTELRARLARYHKDVDGAFTGWNDAWLDLRFRAFDITGYLKAIKVPVLALQGADDPYGSAEQLRVLTRHILAPVDTRVVPGARHAPHLEAADETLSAVADFVQTHLRETAR